MSDFAVFHAQKGSGSGSGLGNHIDREKGKEHTFKNADPTRSKLNKFFNRHTNEYIDKLRQMPLEKAINQRIADGYKGKKKLRKDAVKYIANVFSGSHEKMMKIFDNEKEKNEFIRRSYEFACKTYGEKNIVRFTLHMDEKTPHIHCVAVPLTKDGRLSAKQVLGNRNNLKRLQNEYAKIMEPLGLKRGLSSEITGRKHETAQEYQKRINNEKIDDFKPVKVLGIVNPIKTYKKALNTLKDMDMNERENKSQRKYYGDTTRKTIEKYEREIQELKDKHRKEVQSVKNSNTQEIQSLQQRLQMKNFELTKTKKELNEERERAERNYKGFQQAVVSPQFREKYRERVQNELAQERDRNRGYGLSR